MNDDWRVQTDFREVGHAEALPELPSHRNANHPADPFAFLGGLAG